MIWLIPLISTIPIILSELIDEKKYVSYLSKRFKCSEANTKNAIRILRPTLLIVALWATFFFSWLDGERSARIESTANETNQLTKSICKLDSSNRMLTDSIHLLAIGIKDLTDTNLFVAKSIHQMTKEQSEENTLYGRFDFDYYDTTSLRTEKYLQSINVGMPTACFDIGNCGPFSMYYGDNHQNEYIPYMGGNLTDSISICLSVKREKDLSFMTSRQNKLFISLKVFDLSGNLIIEVKDNWWVRNPNYTSKFNYDNRGIEIFDNKGNIALSINIGSKEFNQNIPYNPYCLNRRIEIKGYFFTLHNHILIAGDNSCEYIDLNNTKDETISNKIKKNKIVQLFEYSGNNWLHKRLTNKIK